MNTDPVSPAIKSSGNKKGSEGAREGDLETSSACTEAAAVTTAWDVFGELSKAHHFFCIIEFSAYFFLSVHNLPFMLFMYFLDNSEVTFLEKKILKEPMALYP